MTFPVVQHRDLCKINSLRLRECSTPVPVPPPTSRQNWFSGRSPQRNFSLFSRVVAEGLFTSNPAPAPKSTLREPAFSEPVHFGLQGEQLQHVEKATCFSAAPRAKLAMLPGSK
jgi:hypothetical protein